MVKQTQRTRRQKPTNCLSVFDHFVGLAIKGFRYALIDPEFEEDLPSMGLSSA